MSYILIDGKMVADKIRSGIADEVSKLKDIYGEVPGIAVILVGDDPASSVYVRSKERAAIKAGMLSVVDRLPGDIAQEELINTINRYNKDSRIHGILVQLPLPKHINELDVILSIDPLKDVDGFHPFNIGELSLGSPSFIPCTPYGIVTLLDEYNIDIAGKLAVVIGRSNIVGKPIGMILTARDATVIQCHSRTKDLKSLCKQADILISAIGKPKFIDYSYVKEGVVIVDVGINRYNDELCGDIDFDSVAPLAKAITPVPKGVGPMTITMLMKNTLLSFIKYKKSY